MKRSIFASFIVWILTVQAALAFSPQSEQQKYLLNVVKTYNDFATHPNSKNLPKGFGVENEKAVSAYMKKNNITGALPKFTVTQNGLFETVVNGQKVDIEINPAGIIRINGETLVLSSKNGINDRLIEIENFLNWHPKTASHNSFLSFIIANAEADCLSKFEASIKAKMPERKGIYILGASGIPTSVWTLAIGIILSVMITPVQPGLLLAGALSPLFLQDKDIAILDKEEAVKREFASLIEIKGALKTAKENKAGNEVSLPNLAYGEDEHNFDVVYNAYSNIVTAEGGIPLAKEEFRVALVEGDKAEKFCKDGLADTVQKVADIISPKPVFNPNEINKNITPATSVVDETRKDSPKPADAAGAEQKIDSSNAVPK